MIVVYKNQFLILNNFLFFIIFFLIKTNYIFKLEIISFWTSHLNLNRIENSIIKKCEIIIIIKNKIEINKLLLFDYHLIIFN